MASERKRELQRRRKRRKERDKTRRREAIAHGRKGTTRPPH